MVSQIFVNYNLSTYIIGKFSSQLATAFFSKVFEIPQVEGVIDFAAAHAILYEETEITSYSLEALKKTDKMTDAQFWFYNLHPTNLTSEQARNFILDYIDAVDGSVNYCVSAIIAEVFHCMMSKNKVVDKSFLTNTIFGVIISNSMKYNILHFKILNELSSNYVISLKNHANFISCCTNELIMKIFSFPENEKEIFLMLSKLFIEGNFIVYKYMKIMIEYASKYFASQKKSNQKTLDEYRMISAFLFSSLTILRSFILSHPNDQENSTKMEQISEIINVYFRPFESKNMCAVDFLLIESFIRICLSLRVADLVENGKEQLESLMTTFYIKSVDIGYEPVGFYSIPVKDMNHINDFAPLFFECLFSTLRSKMENIQITPTFLNFIKNCASVLKAEEINSYVMMLTKSLDSDILYNHYLHSFNKPNQPSFNKNLLQDSFIYVNTLEKCQVVCSKIDEELKLMISNPCASHIYSTDMKIDNEDFEINNEHQIPSISVFAASKFERASLFVDAVFNCDRKNLKFCQRNSQLFTSAQSIAFQIHHSNRSIKIQVYVMYIKKGLNSLEEIIKTDIKDTSDDFRSFLSSIGIYSSISNADDPDIRGKIDNIEYELFVLPLRTKFTVDSKCLKRFIIVWYEDELFKIPVNDVNIIFIKKTNQGFYKVTTKISDNQTFRIIPDEMLITASDLTSVVVNEFSLWKRLDGKAGKRFADSWDDYFKSPHII